LRNVNAQPELHPVEVAREAQIGQSGISIEASETGARNAQQRNASRSEGFDMIRDILIKLTIPFSSDFAANYALSIAKGFEAHLTGIAFAYNPQIAGPMPGLFAPIIFEVGTEADANAAINQFEDRMQREGISGQGRIVTAPSEGSGMFGRLARRFDLSVVGQRQPDLGASQQLIIEDAIFQAGRPVVVVPYVQTAGIKLDQVMICWDGSSTAARAIGDAMPFLERAKSVDVIIVSNEPPKSDEIAGADIAEHLARHRLKVNLRRVGTAGIAVADTLLSLAADSGTDFMVMGGYGHSRAREFILGGTTRGILQSMTVPVLMSH
jgi:nucleotide-binding universal stress UspA family protein